MICSSEEAFNGNVDKLKEFTDSYIVKEEIRSEYVTLLSNQEVGKYLRAYFLQFLNKISL